MAQKCRFSHLSTIKPPDAPVSTIPCVPCACTPTRCNNKTHLFFEFSLCLSRACLGKMITFSIKMAQKRGVFLPQSAGPQRRRPRGCRRASLCGRKTARFKTVFSREEFLVLLSRACLGKWIQMMSFFTRKRRSKERFSRTIHDVHVRDRDIPRVRRHIRAARRCAATTSARQRRWVLGAPGVSALIFSHPSAPNGSAKPMAPNGASNVGSGAGSASSPSLGVVAVPC